MATETPLFFSGFQEYFTVNIANTTVQKDLVYQLRYQVYCEEFQYIPAKNFLDKRETDEFDNYSLHCMVNHKNSGKTAACVRVVMPTTADDLLPFEKHCAKALDSNLIAGLNLNRQIISEICRVAVAADFRKRAGESASRFGDVLDFSDIEKRTCSLITVAAFFSAIALTELTGRTNFFMLLEPFLVKLMKSYGITLQQIGKEDNYHGIRAPYFLTTHAFLEAINPEVKLFYDWIKNQTGTPT